jgi:GTPase SAR1 family protein
MKDFNGLDIFLHTASSGDGTVFVEFKTMNIKIFFTLTESLTVKAVKPENRYIVNKAKIMKTQRHISHVFLEVLKKISQAPWLARLDHNTQMYFCYCPISKFILNKNIGLKAIVITRYF